MKSLKITRRASRTSGSRVSQLRRAYKAGRARALPCPENNERLETETHASTGPVSAFLGHGYSWNDKRGICDIAIVGRPFTFRPKVIRAESDYHLQLIAIEWLLSKAFPRGAIDIYSNDENLINLFGGPQLERWKQQGWRKKGGTLKHAELIRMIASCKEGRSVRFIFDSGNAHLSAIQARASAALAEWRNRGAR